MIITALKKKRNDVIISFDDGTFLSLDYRIVIDFRLGKADQLDEAKIELLKENNSFLKTRDSAFRILARRLNSTFELRTKLVKKKYHKEIIENVLNDLKEKNYLNDEEFAKLFIAERINSGRIGTNRLRAELLRRGINREDASKYLYEIDKENYTANALYIAKKKLTLLKKKENDTTKISVKLYSFLMNKGYEFDVARSVMNELKLEMED